MRKGNEKGRVERPIGFVRRRFWPGRRFRDLLDLNAQAAAWRDDFANGRVHEDHRQGARRSSSSTRRNACSSRSPTRPSTPTTSRARGVTKMFRVPFDRNKYSVPWRLASPAGASCAPTTTTSRVFLGTKQVALHRALAGTSARTSSTPRTRRPCSSTSRAPPPARCRPRSSRSATPDATYFKLLAAGSRSIHRETLRLTFLVELFGAPATESAIAEVMQTGHVGAEYVEYVLRHKRGLVPAARLPCASATTQLDAISLPEPDLSIYDQLSRQPMTRDPGEPRPTTEESST